MIDPRLQRHAFSALLAAALFGASTPLAKLLLRETSPLMLAGLLYLGSGTGLLLLRFAAQRVAAPGAERAARLQAADYPWLAGAIACGGVAAPALLMWGLATTAAGAASLLLNFESVITALI
ncbi:MAG TPA: EamA family transporter, partial [Burkholderiales bacterium]|nr:EamA family transporter [Burkholderiales bacterium]